MAFYFRSHIKALRILIGSQRPSLYSLLPFSGINMITFFKFLIRRYFKKSGWKVQGSIAPGLHKAILVAGGHTSNWDLLFSLGTMYTIDKKFNFIIKKEALVFPIKSSLLAMGAIPVDRDPKATTNYVDELASIFKKREVCYLCIAAEGTRDAVKKWKTGYYHIAKAADIPILPCCLDYSKKIAYIGEPVYPKSTEPETFEEMKKVFTKAVPKHPEKFIM